MDVRESVQSGAVNLGSNIRNAVANAQDALTGKASATRNHVLL